MLCESWDNKTWSRSGCSTIATEDISANSLCSLFFILWWRVRFLWFDPWVSVFVSVFLGSEALYITCKLQNCTEASKAKPFPGYIDPNSLVVQDEYVFVQVCYCPLCWLKIMMKIGIVLVKLLFQAQFLSSEHKVSTAGKPIYYVSAKRDVFTPLKLPKYTLPKVCIDLITFFRMNLISNELRNKLNLRIVGFNMTQKWDFSTSVTEWSASEQQTHYHILEFGHKIFIAGSVCDTTCHFQGTHIHGLVTSPVTVKRVIQSSPQRLNLNRFIAKLSAQPAGD